MKYSVNIHENLNNRNSVSKNLKNIISLITLTLVMLVSVNVSGQSKNYTKTEVSEKLSQVMVSLVESAKPFYSKGDTYKSFRSKLYGKQARINPSEKGEALIKQVYTYLSNGTSQKSMKEGSLTEIADAYLFIYEKEKNSKNVDAEIELFGSSTGDFNPQSEGNKVAKCCFFCLKCHLSTVFGDAGADSIIGAIVEWLVDLINP